MPETSAVPPFAPVRVRGGRYGVRRRRRALAAGLAMTAAALAASGLREPAAAGRPTPESTHTVAVTAPPPDRPPLAADRRRAGSVRVAARPGPRGRAPGRAALVSAPVRIADAETVRLLRPGDRVDVIAAPVTAAGTAAEDGGPPARVVASGVRVTEVPRPEGAPAHGAGAAGEWADGGTAGGALVVVAVPRPTATALAAAAATSRLVVTLC
ncbi:RcpC/CpaB family pilus assembly protein [Streptomyces kanasensis]|uniref:RcpC/CpaB family pilus assembly protein n=1 Tax=Streptomyces kanasensis TaxID=936756 RepID=UPI00380910CC